jgi:hypothetical protein
MAKAKTPRSATSPARSKRTVVEPQFQAVSESRESGNGSAVDIQAEIRQRAYELYQERGYVSGFEQEDWITAEREVLSRHSLQLV